MRARLQSVSLESIETSETSSQAFGRMVDCAASFEIDLVSYHKFDALSLRQDRPRHSQFKLMSSGFPDQWIEHYLTSDYRTIDPITGFAACTTRAVLWSSIADRVEMTDRQQDFIDDLFGWLAPGDGLAVPLFGPSGWHGYAGLGWTRAIQPWTPSEIRMIQAVAESFHLRICELELETEMEAPKLSKPQQRLLRALASGQPDAMICGMVNLRPDALRTAINRLLKSLNVTDRPSAILRARSLGLLQN